MRVYEVTFYKFEVTPAGDIVKGNSEVYEETEDTLLGCISANISKWDKVTILYTSNTE